MESPADRAKEILRMYWDEIVPVSPRAIAERMSVRVIADPDLTFDDLSGQFEYEGDYPTIRYNPYEPIVRQRFTIAHELGHFVLGHGSRFRDPKQNFSSTNFDRKEVAANKFAAALLMPRELVRSLIMEEDIKTVHELAAKLNVSEVAMKYQLEHYGWL